LNYESEEGELSIDPLTTTTSKPPTEGIQYRAAAYSQRSAYEINSSDKPNSKLAFNSLEDIRKREQDEFDRLLGKIVLNEKSTEVVDQQPDGSEILDQTEDDDLLHSGTSVQVPAQQSRVFYNRVSIQKVFESI
jgi:hypothetical protein